MTLRDWFAGQALAGIAANPIAIEAGGAMTELMGHGWRGRMAVEMADSVMEALSKCTTPSPN